MKSVIARCIISNSVYMNNGQTYRGFINVYKGVSYFKLFDADSMNYIIGRHVVIVDYSTSLIGV